jgi:hypothetical protein
VFISFHSKSSCQNLLNLLPCTISRYTPSCGVRAVGLWRHNAKHGLVVDAQEADCSHMLPYRFDIRFGYLRFANVASEIHTWRHPWAGQLRFMLRYCTGGITMNARQLQRCTGHQ